MPLFWHSSMKVVHLKRTLNCLAVHVSRQPLSETEWSMNPKVARTLFNGYRTPMMDLFASYENRKVDLYCSREAEQGAFHSDALTLDWNRLDEYAFVPTPLIHLVLDRIEKYPCVVTLIAPHWPRRSWLPRLLDLLVDFPMQLPVRPDLLQQWKGGSGIRIQSNSDWWPGD